MTNGEKWKCTYPDINSDKWKCTYLVSTFKFFTTCFVAWKHLHVSHCHIKLAFLLTFYVFRSSFITVHSTFCLCMTDRTKRGYCKRLVTHSQLFYLFFSFLVRVAQNVFSFLCTSTFVANHWTAHITSHVHDWAYKKDSMCIHSWHLMKQTPCTLY